MKINLTDGFPLLRKTILLSLMRLSLFLFFTSVFSFSSPDLMSQNVTVRFDTEKELTVDQIFDAIIDQTDYTFIYHIGIFDGLPKIKVKKGKIKANDLLDLSLPKGHFKFGVGGKNIIVVEKLSQNSNSLSSNIAQQNTVEGKVTDSNGTPLGGVNVLVKGTQKGTMTDIDGNFKLKVDGQGEPLLVFSFLGMITQEVKVKDKLNLLIVLKEDVGVLGEVVITGIYSRKKEDFTGSSATYTAEDLKMMGTPNILQSLKTLDPSFAILEDNQFGSDPNRLPNMEIRGKSSMLGIRDELEADPNQPLFILDGFESTLSVINDLDINRVASITVLKDAASTAIYGSKAANGVVVVETVKPEAGKLQVSYAGTLNVAMPDLSSYNLMNAAEKLEFERLAGKYSGGTIMEQIEKNEIYNQKLAAVESGVDTYWLAEPVRVGANQRHSVYVRGGEGDFLFGLGAGYNGITGVVKNSSREVTSGNIDLIYRVDKFQFSNKLSLSSTNSENPIVSFSEYAAANPYYKKYNDEGGLDKWLENSNYTRAPNPMWNDSQNSRNVGKNLNLSNYFIAEYFPNLAWKVRARVGLTHRSDDAEIFTSPSNSQYDGVEILKRGLYRSTNSVSDQFEAEISATYAKVFAEKHQINAVAGGNIYDSKTLRQGYSAQGFPEGNFTYPSFSNGYPEGGAPDFVEYINRSVDGYFNFGYAFNNRYLADVNLRTSGSSVFGVSKRFNTTWSLGLAWNIHNESFIKDNADWINYFKLRASVGNPGNQSFDSSRSMLVYSFQYGSLNNFGLGTTISQLGNPNLQWQTTLDRNVGLDLTVLNNRLTLNVDYFYKVTDPLLISINMPASSGTSRYLTNAGEQTSKGLTAQTSYYIIRNLSERFTWMVRANVRTQKNRLDNIGNKLSALNASGRGTNQVRYYDGSDPDNIWTVRSAGIDPSTGRELFYDKNGGYTYDYSYDNEVVSGNSRPDMEGILGSSLSWKGFTMSMNFRYLIGRDIYNSALYSKVENISVKGLNYNLDKRALYERWQNPGDIVRFKNIASATSTPMSSRFVQRENVFSLESVYLSYEFLDGWIQNLGLSSMRAHVSMRDIFHASTIITERGIQYPFARSIEAGLSLNF